MTINLHPVWAALGLILVSQPLQSAETSPPRYLLLDSRIVDRASDAELTLGQPSKDDRNPLFGADRAWERRLDNVYANVVYDAESKTFHCWYSPFVIDPATEDTPKDRRQTVSYVNAMRGTGRSREMALCYATSSDGITWRKPDLDLYEFNGSRANNLVFRIPGAGEGPHGGGISLIERTGDVVSKYKLIFSRNRQLWIADSFDGIRWSTPLACQGIKVAGDTHNNLLWDSRRERYVAFSRIWDNNVRQVARIDSTDLQSWSPVRMVLQGESPQLQTYAMRVFQYGDLFLGLVMIFNVETDRVHCELAWSPDTVKWHRVCPGTPFVANGPEGSCDYGCVFAGSPPVVIEDQMYLYYGCSDGLHTGWRESYLGRVQLPIDRWAGYESSKNDEGVVTTHPVQFAGRDLYLNAAAGDGSIQVTLLDENGQVMATSEPIHADATRIPVVWQPNSRHAELVGRKVKFEFRLTNAKLYSFGFN